VTEKKNANKSKKMTWCIFFVTCGAIQMVCTCTCTLSASLKRHSIRLSNPFEELTRVIPIWDRYVCMYV